MIRQTSPTPSAISVAPSSESISRRRVYTIAQLRADFRDAQTQYVVLLTQLHDEQFTGSFTVHFNRGNICGVETIEHQKL